ncbi:MAG: hypothetical protein ACI9VT_004248, partial [Psychroserpens sp.]
VCLLYLGCVNWSFIMTIASKVKTRINRSKRYVFARADFTDIAGYDQVGRVLKKLVDAGDLLRIGYGLYTKARKNRITGKLMPASPAGADGVILEAIKKLGIDYKFDEFSQRSIDGDSLQIPASFQIITNNRFKRKIVVSNRAINAN